MSRAELEAALSLDSTNPQQVVRALRALRTAGLVRFEGATRARRYRPVGVEAKGATLPLSPEAAEAIELVGGPLHARRPTSYRRAFLDEYVPQETSYLSAPLRARLRELGQTPSANQPAGTYARHVLERFLIDLTWNSARLEGNTYSLLDTERLLKAGATAEAIRGDGRGRGGRAQ